VFTVYFESPYWVGVLEEERESRLFVARHVFGAEPSDQEIYEFVCNDLDALKRRMSVSVAVETRTVKKINPKRLQREVQRILDQHGISSKAEEVMRLQREVNKKERRVETREMKEARNDYKRTIAKQKAKAKHRGH
jgi:hypothetical protein